MCADAQQESPASLTPQACPTPPASAVFPRADGWGDVTDLRVRAAFARVDRRRFVPEAVRDQADRDEPLPIGEGQTASQPYVVALMLQALELGPGDAVLEIGTGSGYQTALLCELLRAANAGGARPAHLADRALCSVDRSPALLRQAAQALQQAGYAPRLLVGDGALGWAVFAPYQAIIVSAAAPHAPRPLVAQLAEGGRMVIPLGPPHGDQELWLLRRRGSRLAWQSLGGVRFVPFLSPVLDDWRNWIDPATTLL